MREKAGTPYEKLVAEIAGAFYQNNCKVTQGSWVDGPYGRSDMDVLIEVIINGEEERILIECKDYDKAKTGKVGIDLIRELDSKRNELSITKCLICSNSGFTEPALLKAKGVGIGAISVIKNDDHRVKIEIIERIFYQINKIEKFSGAYHFQGSSEGADPSNILYKNLPVHLWLEEKMSLYTTNSSIGDEIKIEKKFRFKHPLQVKSKGKKYLLAAIEGTLDFSKKWYSTDVRLDAKSAIFDYISGQLELSPGDNSLYINGLDIVKKFGKLETEQPMDSELGITFNKHKDNLKMYMIEGLHFKSHDEIPKLDSFILDEDLTISMDHMISSQNSIEVK